MADEAPAFLVRVLPPYDVEFPGVYQLAAAPDPGQLLIGQEAPAPAVAAPEVMPSVVVRVRAPLNIEFPDEYPVEAISETGAWKIAGGVDFDPTLLEVI